MASQVASKIAREMKCLIVGSGPAGLTAAIYAARANLKPIVATGSLDPKCMPGGQLMTTTEVENFPGFPDGITGPNLMDNMFIQAKKFGAEFVDNAVSKLMVEEGPQRSHLVQLGDEIFAAQAIICATGASARWLNVPGHEQFVNKGVSACATCDGPLPLYRDKHVCVVGGGDSAIEEALFLAKFAKNITIIHRRNQLRASKIMIKRALENPKISILWDSVCVGYKGKKTLDTVVVENVNTKEHIDLSAAGCFMALGHTPNTQFLVDTPVQLDEDGYIVTHNSVYTKVPGIFAAGDVHDKNYRQAITASGLGCMSALATEKYISSL